MPTLLHAACGPSRLKDLDWMRDGQGKATFEGWDEVRLDIDDEHSPDIIGDMRDRATWTWMPRDERAPLTFDGVFCSHALEHLHLYDAPKALASFRSVLAPAGFVVVIVPNFEAACRHVVEGRGESLYTSAAGPIFAHEVIYGKENWTRNKPYMRHLTGYTPDLLRGLFIGCGFAITSFSVDSTNLIIGAVSA